MRGGAKCLGALAGAIGALVLLAAPAGAGAAVGLEYRFDPVLSLEGNCNAKDGVADPGCPYPPPPDGPQPFQWPCDVEADQHGDIYVANPKNGSGSAMGEVAVFDPAGNFLARIPNEHRPCRVAVDSVGNVYVAEDYILDDDLHEDGEGNLFTHLNRYEPSSFPPDGSTEYSPASRLEFLVKPAGGFTKFCVEPEAVAVDPSNDHLYVAKSCRVEEYGPGSEGNPLLDCCIGEGAAVAANTAFLGLDVYGANHDVYVVSRRNDFPTLTTVDVLDGATGESKCHLTGTGQTPFPEFDFGLGGAIAVDQSDGELFVYDHEHEVIDRFAPDGEGGEDCGLYSFAGELPPPTTEPNPNVTERTDIAVDSPCLTGPGLSESCDIAGYSSPNEREVFVTVGFKPSESHLYAFKPRVVDPPTIEDQEARPIGEREALLRARLNPGGLRATYRFEYVSQAGFEASGYAGATAIPVPEGDAGDGASLLPVSAEATGLLPGTAYRFRLVASNCAAEEAEPGNCLTEGEGSPGGEGEDATFSTYPVPPPSGRAFELVTPPDTGGKVPTMTMLGNAIFSNAFATRLASVDGGSLVFGSRSGALPGLGGGGFQDVYEAKRTGAGWQSAFTGLSGTRAEKPAPGGISPDHRYAFWDVPPEDRGSLIEGNERGRFLAVPPGTASSPNCGVESGLEWIGCGSLGADRLARGLRIGVQGGYVLFQSLARLEECAPTGGRTTIYDRAPGGLTRCVSLLPGDVTPTQETTYRGASLEGDAVAFAVSDTLYVRLDNAETLAVAAGSPTFAGIAEDGSRVFYLQGGNLFAFDTGTEEATQIGSGGETTPVYVSPDGSHAFFTSPALLDGGNGEAGADNLYAWDGAAVSFIAVLEPTDMTQGGADTQGLGKWISHALDTNPGGGTGPAWVPARSNPDGSVFVFESRADLAGAKAGGQRQVYRYEGAAPSGEELRCLSCDPTGAPTASAGQLQPISAGDAFVTVPPVNAVGKVENVADDGRRVFFQSSARLVAADADGHLDVYEWRAAGEGDCARPDGCLLLVSSPRSSADEHIYAMTPDGSDVFFLSGDVLTAQDPDGTRSIYDARLGGGLSEPSERAECLGEACQPTVEAPNDSTPASSSFQGVGNQTSRPEARRCPKGKRKVRRAGKARCVKRQTKKQRPKRQRHDHGRAAR